MMDVLPYPQATTREQARANAMFYAEVEGTINREKALTWATIALAFPEESEFLPVMADDQTLHFVEPPTDVHWSLSEAFTLPQRNPEPVEVPTAVINPAGDPTRTVPVDSYVYDVLRALAMRYVASSLTTDATVDLLEEQSRLADLDFVIRQNPDDANIFRLSLRPRE